MPFITITADDQAGMAWYNAQTPLVRQFWHGMADSAAPIDAWIAFRDMAAVCTPPDVSVGAEPAGSTPAVRGECTPSQAPFVYGAWRNACGRWTYMPVDYLA